MILKLESVNKTFCFYIKKYIYSFIPKDHLVWTTKEYYLQNHDVIVNLMIEKGLFDSYIRMIIRKDFDFIFIGGGCAGLSLAYELEIHKKLENKSLAIIEPRLEYKKDKTWSFWRVEKHNFDDCVKKNWEDFSINVPSKTKHL